MTNTNRKLHGAAISRKQEPDTRSLGTRADDGDPDLLCLLYLLLHHTNIRRTDRRQCSGAIHNACYQRCHILLWLCRSDRQFIARQSGSRMGHSWLGACNDPYCVGWWSCTYDYIPAALAFQLTSIQCKAVLATFIADQYPDRKPRLITLKDGERVVTDYELTLQYIYSLYFWVGNIGSLSWFAVVYLERRYGFACAYALCTSFMAIATLVLVFGKHWYSMFTDLFLLSMTLIFDSQSITCSERCTACHQNYFMCCMLWIQDESCTTRVSARTSSQDCFVELRTCT